ALAGGRYRRPVRARVLGADGRPLGGVSVTFTIAAGPAGAGASFLGGGGQQAGGQASALTDTTGQASSPPLLANSTPGRFSASASIHGPPTPLRHPLPTPPATRRAAPPAAAPG